MGAETMSKEGTGWHAGGIKRMIDIDKARKMLDWAEGDPQSDSAFIGRSWIFGHVAQMLDELETHRRSK